MEAKDKSGTWVKVFDSTKELADARVMKVTAENHDYCLAPFEGLFCALDNKYPPKRGPLGERSSQNNLLRCP